MSDILCLGEPLVEFVRLENGTYKRGFGGDTSNAAIAAARQGASVGYLTVLGADRFGDSVLDLWAREGVDASNVRRTADAPTGIYFVDPHPEGRFFTYYRAGSAASRMRPDDLPLEAIRAARCLHVSGITLAVSDDLRATAFAAMEAARQAGAAVSLDTNLRVKLWTIAEARAVTHEAMRLASVAVTSIDDSAHLTGLQQSQAIADFYHDLGVETVLVTMGMQGCHLSGAEGATTIPAAPARPVDSTGAGDSFAGAYLAWWLETGDPVLAGQRAARVAAGTVSGLGAVDPIPHRADVLAAERAADG
ncbi:MAG: sugar kinase [Pseudomonadota bacterium]